MNASSNVAVASSSEAIASYESNDGPMFSVYNNESPTDVYKSMAGGTAQVNPLSDFLQENEQNMKSNVNVFNGSGFNLGSELPYIELVGPKDTFVSSNVSQVCDEECLKKKYNCDPDRPWKECAASKNVQ